MTKKLYRSTNNKILSGVCAGIGDYLNLDPTIIRLLAVLALFTTNIVALIAYIVCIVIIPENPVQPTPNDYIHPEDPSV